MHLTPISNEMVQAVFNEDYVRQMLLAGFEPTPFWLVPSMLGRYPSWQGSTSLCPATGAHWMLLPKGTLKWSAASMLGIAPAYLYYKHYGQLPSCLLSLSVLAVSKSWSFSHSVSLSLSFTLLPSDKNTPTPTRSQSVKHPSHYAKETFKKCKYVNVFKEMVWL